jgi:uncharacterized protein (DUF927 family)
VGLYAAVKGLNQGEAAKALAQELGLGNGGQEPPQAKRPTPTWTPILPVPDDAPAPTFRHPRLGVPVASWPYLDGQGRVLGYACRFETPEGKEILPMTYGRDAGGTRSWRWKSFPDPRPLYGLDSLAKTGPDVPVLVVEGEKTADAAQRVVPSMAAMTWPGGCKAVAKADFAPLAGRMVFVWPDADAPGIKAAEDVAVRALKAGAGQVFLVENHPDAPSGWDIADGEAKGMTSADALGWIEDHHRVYEPRTQANESLLASGQEQKSYLPDGFSRQKSGIYYAETSKNPEGEQKVEYRFLCSNFAARAMTRDVAGESWGLVLEIPDPDGEVHPYVMPKSALAGDGTAYREEMLSRGLDIAAGKTARAKLHELLTRIRPQERARCVSRAGWHDRRFVLPDGTAYGDGQGRIILQPQPRDHAFQVAGTLADWQHAVGRYAPGNTLLTLALCCGPAAVLGHVLQVEGGGFHLFGRSSTGKTTCLRAAGSFCGGGGLQGFIRSWRATDNALEAVAASHCDNLLCLDEVGQAAPETVAATIYMLGNQAGKSRAKRDGSGRKTQEWRVLWLSSGEVEIAAKVQEKSRHHAGQEVRAIDLEFQGFQELHGFGAGRELADHLKRAAARFYGAPLRAFLEKLTADTEGCRELGEKEVAAFVKRMTPGGADGQVSRVAARFGLLAAAGEIATKTGIMPWEQGEATRAAEDAFEDWLKARGGAMPAEVRDGVAAVRAFIQAHGQSRFQGWNETSGGDDFTESRVVVNRAGFRWKPAKEGEPADYLIFPDVFRKEVLRGLDPKATCEALDNAGLLVRQDKRHWTNRYRIPQAGPTTVFHIRAGILDE